MAESAVPLNIAAILSECYKSLVHSPDDRARRYDLVLVGATGFTGELTAKYLAAHGPRQLRWALVGRNRPRLTGVVAELTRKQPNSPQPDILVADTADWKALRVVAETARVVVSTVGPYVLYGEPLVAACVAAGTDYLDITGEAEFVDRIWLKYHAEAERNGVRLVHCCGFVALAEDLGAYFTVQQLPEDAPISLDGHLHFRLRFSGGSFHSLVHNFARFRQQQAVARNRQKLESRAIARKVHAASGRVRRDSRLGGWTVPSASISAVTVCRTAATLTSYGPEFSYGHHLVFRRLATLCGFALAMVAAAVLMRLAPIRRLLLKVKRPGVGPGKAERDRSWFELVFIGEAAGKTVVTKVNGGDPGYDETAKMLAESALCIAFDDPPRRSGQLTPAVAMGDAILERLEEAGISFQVVNSSGPRT